VLLVIHGRKTKITKLQMLENNQKLFILLVFQHFTQNCNKNSEKQPKDIHIIVEQYSCMQKNAGL
jgi:hypothetical protein